MCEMIVRHEALSDAHPSPARARPKMKILEVGAKVHIMEPSRKITCPTKAIDLVGKTVQALPKLCGQRVLCETVDARTMGSERFLSYRCTDQYRHR